MKTVNLEVANWKGTLDLLDPIPLPLVLDIDDALEILNVEQEEDKPVKISGTKLVRGLLAPCLACVVKWQVDGLPERLAFETFPGSPKGDSMKLALFVVGEVMEIYNGEAGGLNPTRPELSSVG